MPDIPVPLSHPGFSPLNRSVCSATKPSTIKAQYHVPDQTRVVPPFVVHQSRFLLGEPERVFDRCSSECHPHHSLQRFIHGIAHEKLHFAGPLVHRCDQHVPAVGHPDTPALRTPDLIRRGLASQAEPRPTLAASSPTDNRPLGRNRLWHCREP